MNEMTLEEAFAAATVDVPAGMVDDIFVIDAPNRKIIVPDSESTFGVETDMDVERKYFRCPRIVGDNIDLYAHKIYVVFVTAKDVKGTFLPEIVNDRYWCDDVAVDGDCITFSWLLSENVLSRSGIIAFKVLAVTTENGKEKTRWNTAPAYGTILLTVPDGETLEEQYPDIVTQLLERMDAVEEIATEEAMQGYVNTYLAEHPAELDETLTDNTKAAPANLVGELKSDIEQLKQNGGSGSGTEKVESRLKGHTMGVIGDSLSDRSRGVTQWFDWIASRAGGMNLSLDCVSGRRLMQFPSDGLSNQCDIICVFGGTNDFNSAQELGTLDTANTDGKTTFYGAVYTLATELMTNYTKSVIIFITPLSSAPAYNSAENYKWYEYPSMGGHTMKDFCDAIKEVCCYLHIPVVDLFENSGLNYNYDTDNIYFVSDKLHLTDAGQEAISYVIETKILEHYIPDNANVTEIVTLSSISAEFTQGDSLYYPSSSLSDLKENLVVSATYSDGTSNVITDYSLSGTLTEGISTITVNYLGKTATFEVTVLAEGASEPFIVTLIPDTTLGVGFYYENDFETFVTKSPTNTNIICIYSEPVSIAGYSKIASDPDNKTYNWLKIAKVEEDGTIIGGCLIVYYDKDMNAISGEPNYDQYIIPSSNVMIATGLALKNNGTIPDGAVYFRALLNSSSVNTNTLKIS